LWVEQLDGDVIFLSPNFVQVHARTPPERNTSKRQSLPRRDGGKMIKISKFAATCIAAGALIASTAPAAHAAPPEPFTITENIDFNSEEPPTFTATGALCDSGTFEDEVIAVGGGRGPNSKANFQIRTVYTCDDGTGTFFAQKHVFLTANEDGSSTNTGPITLHGGTGDYTRLNGHGVDEGTASADGIGIGTITGVVTLR
jgi:hypothetical protein